MINVRAFTDVGLVRKRNEDAILVAGWLKQTREGSLVTMDFALSTPFVCAVADGMGGHAGGDLASRVALTVVAEESLDWRTDEDIAATLVETNARVRAVGVDADLQGLGTTVGGLCITDDAIVVFNVGDSPVFSITDGVLTQISIDDSVFDSNGRPTNIITQSLGQFPPVQPHLTVLPRQAGSYLMCSDGVSGVMTPAELATAVHQSDLDDLAADIIATTRANGAHDNFSFIIVAIPDLDDAI
ncbi:PP2C family protein-serine/threonine phosphatase [Mycobacterium antarcticum]|uniref:PP2C family protein-serine/threonine phosphatase n=1 Tax=unclassified Mycolicibacterium TaxID=2636767 RepID=UPI0024E13265|nr:MULTISPECIES: protein phosphatase 2C domain-containing protein [unclassified Mycolicibacterium]